MPGICVLLVDDSLLFREMMAQELLRYLPEGSRVEKAADPFEARDKILDCAPDVMLLDIEMPKMDGIEFLKRLLMQYTQPTIMISGTAAYRDMAIAAGAADFIVKPDGHILRAGSQFFSRLAARLCAVAIHAGPKRAPIANGRSLRKKLIAIGASTGGTEALAAVLKALQPPLPGIVVVQHIPVMFSRLFAERLEAECSLTVKEAANGDLVKQNHVYIAPGDKHVRVKGQTDMLYLECASGARVNGHCPSVDVLFFSVAECLGESALGVILTGMGNDGAKGMLAMRQAGAATIGQDERSCVVYGMPRVAWELGAVERQLPLPMIAGAITSLVNR